MASEAKIIFAYAGVLEAFDPQQSKKVNWWMRFLRSFLITYKQSSVYETNDRTGEAIFNHVVRFREKYPELVSSVLFQLWGSIAPQNVKRVKELGLTEIIKIEGFKSRSETRAKLLDADVMLLPLESGRNGQRPLALPSKLFDYLLLGKPVLILSEESDCSDILIAAGIGIRCAPHDLDMAADKMAELILQKSKYAELFKPRKEYIEEFSFRYKAAEMERVFNRLIETT